MNMTVEQCAEIARHNVYLAKQIATVYEFNDPALDQIFTFETLRQKPSALYSKRTHIINNINTII
jgi:hypothetical protein